MAERKSVNKYYPPDWDPSKGSVNNYVGQHPLRDRAKKLSQGILVIRFEMPYNIWCGGCNSHIGMGVRYNAEKTKTGMYYTTPIYKFRMKCHLCPNYFEIQTDPKNHDYVILEGARRKEQRWDPKENEQIVPEDRATHKKMATDAMFKLEHGSDDVKKSKAVVMNLSSLEGRRDEWRDDYILNKIARQKFRDEKKTIKSAKESDEALLAKSSLEIPLVKEQETDKKLAQLMKYRTVESYDEKKVRKRKEIQERPIFQSNKVQKIDMSPANKKKLNIIRKHLSTAGNKSGPFDSVRSQSLKAGLVKLDLGIRRKPVKIVDHTDKEVQMDKGIGDDVRTGVVETVTASKVSVGTHSDMQDKETVIESEKESSNESNSVTQFSEQENTSIDKMMQVHTELKNDKHISANKLNIDQYKELRNESTFSDNLVQDESKMLCKPEDGQLKETEIKHRCLESDKLLQTEQGHQKTEKLKSEKDPLLIERGLKPEYDSDPRNNTFDNLVKTATGTDRERNTSNSINNEMKPDRKSLSLVASYSDSDSSTVSDFGLN